MSQVASPENGNFRFILIDSNESHIAIFWGGEIGHLICHVVCLSTQSRNLSVSESSGRPGGISSGRSTPLEMAI